MKLKVFGDRLRTTTSVGRIDITTDERRNQVIALAAAALASRAFASIESHDSLESLDDLLKQGVPFRAAPELFCLDLYRYFDLDRLALMAAPTTVSLAAKKVAAEDAVK